MSTYDKEYLQEQHLLGKLSPEEQKAFDQILEADPDFAREVKAGELAVEGLKSLHVHNRVQELRKQMSAGQGEEKPEKPVKKKEGRVISLLRRPLSIAASVALLIAAAYFIYLSYGSQSLYDQYSRHPSFSVTEMSSAPSYDLSRAETAFQQGDYEVSQTELSAYLAENPTDTMALLFQGICQLELDNFSQAERIFGDIRAGTSDVQEQGEWYLALTYVKQKDTARARGILNAIPQSSEKYTQAQELLKNIGE